MKKLFLSLAIVGLGTLASAQQNQPEMQAQKAEGVEMVQLRQDRQILKMKSELNLSEAQVSKIKAIQERNAANRKMNVKVMEGRRAMMREKRSNNENEFKQILNPEQYKIWETNRNKKMEMRKAKMERRQHKMDKKSDRMHMKHQNKNK